MASEKVRRLEGELFILTEELRPTNKPTYRGTVMDVDGAVWNYKRWDEEPIAVGTCFTVTDGYLERYNGELFVNTNSMKVVDGDNDPTVAALIANYKLLEEAAELARTERTNRSLPQEEKDANRVKLEKYLRDIPNSLGELLRHIFYDMTREQLFDDLSLEDELHAMIVIDSLCEWAAAKANHHAYRGGLCEHTLQVTKFVEDLMIDPRLDVGMDINVAIGAALLHDIGKLKEYSVSGESREGWHPTLGAEAVERAAITSGIRLDYAQVRELMKALEQHHAGFDERVDIKNLSNIASIVHGADMLSSRCGYWIVEPNEDEPTNE